MRAWRTQKKLVRDAVKILGRENQLEIRVNDTNADLNYYGYYGYYGYDRGSSRIGSNSLPGRATKAITNLVFDGK